MTVQQAQFEKLVRISFGLAEGIAVLPAKWVEGWMKLVLEGGGNPFAPLWFAWLRGQGLDDPPRRVDRF